MKQKIMHIYKKYGGILLLAVLLAWVKTYISYRIDFNLGVKGWLQHLILVINPLACTLFLFSFSLFARNVKRGHKILVGIYLFNALLLYANVLYYREFTDFITLSSIVEARSIFVGGGNFITGALSLVKWHDFFYFLDSICLLFLIRRRQSSLVLTDQRLFYTQPIGKKAMVWSLIILAVNLGLAEISRPMLLTRTFDRHYIVKYLGISGFIAYDSVQAVKSISKPPEKEEIEMITDYAVSRYAAPDSSLFSAAKGRNLITIHMESLQQFLIDYQYTDEDGEKWEVLPFLNELYHSKDSISFSNLFTQIGQGKSSDAELMTETSLFGLPRGSAYVKDVENAYYATPQILRCKAGYTSAAFHGNTGSFWNRMDMYKGLGYDYFFDADDFNLTKENSTEYGLKDKLFFQQSVQYLEQLQQPFYAKYITLSNHFPFPYDENNDTFPQASTSDASVNGYFATSNYADQALNEFFNYLKKAGIYENSIIVLYGDHFGISDDRNKTLAPLLDRDPSTWTEFDDMQMKRVPLMIHIPGFQKGYVNNSYAGQIDILPTVLHLLGIDTRSQILMGQDLLSPDRDEFVAFRNGSIISPVYTTIGDHVYRTPTGQMLDEKNKIRSKQIEQLSQKAIDQLTVSDLILNTDFLATFQPLGLTPVQRDTYDYFSDPARLKDAANQAGAANTSIYYQNHRTSTGILYRTDAPEQGTAEP